jgi:hypothetical protein
LGTVHNLISFEIQSVFMKDNASTQHKDKAGLDALKDIRDIMERSSRFKSLSGWSAVVAGLIGMAGAWFAAAAISASGYQPGQLMLWQDIGNTDLNTVLISDLFLIAILTFLLAFVSAIYFTYLRNRKLAYSFWNSSSKRVMMHVAIPMIVSLFFLLRIIQLGVFGLIIPVCLIFYGLGLVNASKFTITEVGYLGIGMILLGLVNSWFIPYGLYFWTAGFGILHIVYGIFIWVKYEKNPLADE